MADRRLAIAPPPSVIGHRPSAMARPSAFRVPRSAFLLGFLLAALLGATPAARAQVPTIDVPPVGATNIANTIVSLTVVASGPGPLSYQWYFNLTNQLFTSGATTPTLLYTNVLKSHEGLYTVAVRNASGSVTSAPVILRIIEPPFVLRQPTNVTVAVGGSATFRVVADGEPPLTYQWFFNVIEPILDATNSTLVLTNLQPTNAGTYQVEITNEADTMHSREALLTVKFPPAIPTPPADLSVPQGQTATFTPTVTGDAPLTFQWFFNNGNGVEPVPTATNATLILPNVQPAQAGQYSLRAANDVGAATSAPAMLTVLAPPVILQQPTNLTVNLGAPASFSVSATGDAPLSYQWFYQATNALPDATNAALLLPAAQAADAGAYTVRVTNPAGAVTSAAALLTVLTAPVLTQQPSSLTVFQGQLATFNVTATGSAPLAYQWFFNGTNRVAGAAGPALTLLTVQPTNAGFYHVVVTNRAGAATSQVAQLTVLDPPRIVQQPANRATTPGGTATFSVLVEGGAPLLYQWFFNDTPLMSDCGSPSDECQTALGNPKSPILTLTNVQPANAGNYSVRVTNAAGFAISANASLTIKLPPVITQPPASLIVTQGSAALFNVAVTGDGPLGYRWFFNETNALSVPSSPTLSIVNVQPAHAGLYSVLVTNDAASALSATATLTVRVPPAITQHPADAAVPPGGSAAFTVTAEGDAPLTYQWFFETTNALPDATNATLTIADAQPANDGRYSVRVSNDVGVTHSATAFLRVRNLPTIAQAPASLTVTQGHTAVFTVLAGGDGPFTYQWFYNATNPIPGARDATLTLSNVPPSAAGAYSVHVTNLVGFAISPEASLTVRLVPTITQQPAGLTVAVGATATFSVAVTGEAPFTYQWRRDETNLLAEATNATLTLTGIQLADAGRYSVVINNEVGAATSADALLVVLVPPSIVQQPASLVSTQRLSATLTVVAGGDAPLSYQWFHQGVNPVPNATNATLTLDNLQPSDAGDYFARVTNLVGAIDSAPATLTVELLPQITEQPASLIVTQGQTATFTVVATNDLPMTYQWRHNGASLPAATEATLTLSNIQPANAGAYDVIVANARGAVTSVVASLTVRGIDFGDAPSPAYPTLLLDDGARHVLIPGMFLGLRADAEPDGLPSSVADGDDLAASNDEDGVRFLAPPRVGQLASIEVIASTDGLLNAWIDFDAAGGWAQEGEQVLTNQTVSAGTNVLRFAIPANAVVGPAFARFRFSSAPDLAVTGLAPDGEVEDYALTIAPAADLEVTHSGTDTTVVAGDSAAYLVRVVNRGPSPATGVTVATRLSVRSTFLSATTTQGACTNGGGVVYCDLGSLPVDAEAEITIVATIGQGTNTATATATADEFDPITANNTAAHAIAGTITLPQFANSDVILLPVPDSGPGDPYPANIIVSGAVGAVSKVFVTLRNVNHDFPDDMDVLLVGPRGQAVMLMSDCGFDRSIVDAEITLSDDAAEPLPDNDPVIVSGSYRPANYGVPNDPFPPPAPAGPYAGALSAFKGTDPNGVWSLYVVDDSLDNGGSDIPGFIADGWTLNIVTDDPLADLAVAAVAQSSSVPVGGNLLYTLTVTNRGPAASEAVLRDVLPPGVAFVSANASQGGCVNLAGELVCELGSLPAGGTATVTLQVVPSLAGGLTNTVTVAGSQLDLNAANNAATVISTILPVADLGVTLSGPSSSVLQGQAVSYSLVVSNGGPNPATGVVLTNVLPAGMVFLSANSSQGQCANVGGVVQCSLGTLAAGGTAAVQISARTGAPGVNIDFASVAAAELDFDAANNSAQQGVEVVPAADVLVSVSPAAANVAVGRDFTTLLTVSNRGPSGAEVWLTNSLPPGVVFVSATAPRGQCGLAGAQVECQFTNLLAGEGATVALVWRAPALGTLTNVVQVAGSVADANPANNAFTNLVSVVPSADLALTVSDRPDPVFLGDDLFYALAVTNHGPNAATSVSLTNVLPAGVSFISAVLGQGSCGRAGQVVTCSLGTLAPGAGATVSLLVRPTVAGAVSNRASVGSQTIDASPGNNVAAEGTLILSSSGTFTGVSPVLLPVQGPASPFPSSIFVSGLTASVFHVRATLHNLSHSFADDVDVLLVGPGGQSVVLLSDAGGESSLNNVSLTFDDLVTGGLPDTGSVFSGVVRPANFGIDADVFPAPAPAGPYGTNLAVFNGTDPNGLWSLYVVDDADKDSGLLAGGWSLTFTTVDPIADVGVSLASVSGGNTAIPLTDPVALGVGSNVVFSYTVTNRGPAAARNVRLTNQVPAFLTSRTFTTSQGACGFVGDSLVCGLGNLPAGATATVAVGGMSPVVAAGTNLVAVGSDFTDLRPTNNALALGVVFELPPVVTLQPMSQSAPVGTDVQLTATASGAEPLQFQWQRNGVDVPGATSPTLALNGISPEDMGVYRLRVSNAVGVAVSDPALLVISGPPVVSALADLVIDEDTDTGLVPFTVQDFDTPVETLTLAGASSNPALVPPANIVFNGGGSNRMVRVTPLPNQSGAALIGVIVSDSTGAATTNQFLLSVRSVVDGIQIITQPSSLIVLTGATANLSVTAASTLPLAYQWQRNEENLAGANAPSLSLPNVQSTDAGTYRVLISNADTNVVSVSVDLQVMESVLGPTIVSIVQTGATVAVSFTSAPGANYTLEYTDSFSPPAWTALGSLPGTGNILSIIDPAVTSPTRFYRVRVN